jgi:hypothetical protein
MSRDISRLSLGYSHTYIYSHHNRRLATPLHFAGQNNGIEKFSDAAHCGSVSLYRTHHDS